MDNGGAGAEGPVGGRAARHRASCSTASRASSPAANVSGSPWRGRWCATPQVFLLDEPLSNLDAKLRATARDELKQFQERVGTTTIYVTHDQVEAMGLGDRIAVMDHGKVVSSVLRSRSTTTRPTRSWPGSSDLRR